MAHKDIKLLGDSCATGIVVEIIKTAPESSTHRQIGDTKYESVPKPIRDENIYTVLAPGTEVYILVPSTQSRESHGMIPLCH